MVYPRVCGGNGKVESYYSALEGLSPRVRGKPVVGQNIADEVWSIPACAGETRPPPATRPRSAVYPRVCGGNVYADAAAANAAGLSPRVRGKRCTFRYHNPIRRSIPACAGETWPAAFAARRAAVYPRVCGGNTGGFLRGFFGHGLSPRVRGKRPRNPRRPTRPRSIPACAGETPLSGTRSPVAAVYPRVCGGNTSMLLYRKVGNGLSPRVRGKRDRRAGKARRPGSIPACAGETGAAGRGC